MLPQRRFVANLARLIAVRDDKAFVQPVKLDNRTIVLEMKELSKSSWLKIEITGLEQFQLRRQAID